MRAGGLQAGCGLAIMGLLALSSSLASAQECECPDPLNREREPGVIWRGPQPVALAEVAAIAAPILWFSPDEPLLYGEGGLPPEAHPCDPEPAESSVVYYQPRIIRLFSGDEPLTEPVETDPDFFSKVASLNLRYYFYYREDVGVGGHMHDLEVAECHIVPSRSLDGCYELRVSRVVGLAHGVDWYSNILDVEWDTRFPITLLVEESKHASCPDRNGDGIYTPGYDVNVHINDAWGVRDVLGSGALLGSSYEAAMTKPRNLADRVGPRVHDDLCGSLPGSNDAIPIERHYDLRPGSSIVMCEIPHGDHLAAMMKDHGMGRAAKPTQYEANSIKDLGQPFKKHTSIVPGISYRYDGATYGGFSVLLRGASLGEFWVVPKFNLQRLSLSGELLFTASASRWVDWYFTFGAERFDKRTKKVDGEEIVISDAAWREALEIGIKFRFRAPGKLRYGFLGYGFGGLRLGVRANELHRLQSPRVVVEIGAGVW